MWEILTHPASGDRRTLDFTLRLEALDHAVADRRHARRQEGFWRLLFPLRPADGGAAKTLIRTDRGIAKSDGVLARHPWAQISGMFQGKPAGARIEDDPSNPGYPHNGWLLRHGFGFLNVSYPGLEPLTLEPGKPLVLKYRVVLMSGAPSRGRRIIDSSKLPLRRHIRGKGYANCSCAFFPLAQGYCRSQSR